MAEISTRTGLRWLWVSVVVFIIDQLTKYWTVQSLDLYESYRVLSFFNFTYAQNPGAAFSFLEDAGGWQKYLFSVIAFAVSAYLIYSLKNNKASQRWSNIAFALVLAGALGNVFDRMMFGYVVDFLDFDLGFYRWPTFNIADVSIFIGAAMIILESFFTSDNKNDENNVEQK